MIDTCETHGIKNCPSCGSFKLVPVEPKPDVCPECGGKGICPETGRGSDGFIRCETCNGEGKVLVGADEGIDCPDCNGRGSWVEKDDTCNAVGDPCDKCGGTGKVKPDEGLREEIRPLITTCAYVNACYVFLPDNLACIECNKKIDKILAKVASHYQALEEHCSELVDDVIRLEAEKKQLQAKIEGYISPGEVNQKLNNLMAASKWSIEEAKKEGFDEGVRRTTDAIDSTFSSQLKEAKKDGYNRGVEDRLGLEDAQSQKITKLVAEIEAAWELQDTLLGYTVLNQNAPKIVLTNDEAGWYATYYPEPPFTDNGIQIIGGDPLEAIKLLKQALKQEEE